jgi:hypothetical protein
MKSSCPWPHSLVSFHWSHLPESVLLWTATHKTDQMHQQRTRCAVVVSDHVAVMEFERKMLATSVQSIHETGRGGVRNRGRSGAAEYTDYGLPNGQAKPSTNPPRTARARPRTKQIRDVVRRMADPLRMAAKELAAPNTIRDREGERVMPGRGGVAPTFRAGSGLGSRQRAKHPTVASTATAPPPRLQHPPPIDKFEEMKKTVEGVEVKLDWWCGGGARQVTATSTAKPTRDTGSTLWSGTSYPVLSG